MNTNQLCDEFTSTQDQTPLKRFKKVGDFMYPSIKSRHGRIASALTRMILDLGVDQLMWLMRNAADFMNQSDWSLESNPSQNSKQNVDSVRRKSKSKRDKIVGEYCYSKIASIYGEKAGKLTGMLLSLDLDELIVVYEDDQALLDKAYEMAQILDYHAEKTQNFLENLDLIRTRNDSRRTQIVEDFIHPAIADRPGQKADLCAATIQPLDLYELVRFIHSHQGLI